MRLAHTSVIEGMATGFKRNLAMGAGLAAVLAGCLFTFLKPPSYRGPVTPMDAPMEQLAKRLQGHVQHLAGKIGARSLTKAPGGLERAAMYIEETLGGFGYKPERQTFSVSGYFQDGFWGATHAVQGTANVIAEIRGVDLASEIVVIGSHYDSAYDTPAANDNASGVAAMLEVARALAAQKPRRTIRFVAFTNEEPPFFRSNDMGSYRYATECKGRRDNIVAMVSLETIGYYSDAPNSQRFPTPALALLYPTTGNFISFVGKVDSRSQLDQCAKAFNAAVRFPSEVLAAPAELAGVDFSDQYSFWRVGYPGIMVTDTAMYRYPHYHAASDTPDKLNYDDLARVTRGLEAVVVDLANHVD